MLVSLREVSIRAAKRPLGRRAKGQRRFCAKGAAAGNPCRTASGSYESRRAVKVIGSCQPTQAAHEVRGTLDEREGSNPSIFSSFVYFASWLCAFVVNLHSPSCRKNCYHKGTKTRSEFNLEDDSLDSPFPSRRGYQRTSGAPEVRFLRSFTPRLVSASPRGCCALETSPWR